MNIIRAIKFDEQALPEKRSWNWGFIGCVAGSLFCWGVIIAIIVAIVRAA